MPEREYLSYFSRFDAESVYAERGWLIGKGPVGGKAKGLAFAYFALKDSPLQEAVSLPPSTLVVSTEIFRDFIQDNRMEWVYSEPDTDRIDLAFSKGRLRESFLADLARSMETLGDRPLAIRSSSLLEDSVRLSFAGKYDTCFSANTGTPERRLRELQDGIRAVWASLFNPAPRAYRNKHGFRDEDEAMAVLVQPIMGKAHGHLYYPELAGAAFSKVYRRPTPRVRKEDGLMRICFGLGTRTVDRAKARVFYLTNPNLRPEGNQPGEIAMASQVDFDYIDRNFGSFMTGSLRQFLPYILKQHKSVHSFVEIYTDNLLYWAGSPLKRFSKPIFSFSALPTRHPYLFQLMRTLLAHLEKSTGFPVDIEFTYETETRELSLIQMRPLAAYSEMAKVEIPEVSEDRLLLRGNRMVSNGILEKAEHLVYVDPDLYGTDATFYEVARAVGNANASLAGTRYVLVGPGRWGSTNPDLGVPVKYNEICHCGCLVEVGIRESNFTPELSYGTHFFLDLDVDGILYLPVFAGESGNVFNKEWFDNSPYEKGHHPAVRIYHGNFAVYMDGDSEIGQVVLV
ncbi:MAG: pyruvate, phosphate dikinase [Synergistaceae bacterium]|nr:pyruvate, phosphate dikinase [Synergistaceae bacterium]